MLVICSCIRLKNKVLRVKNWFKHSPPQYLLLPFQAGSSVAFRLCVGGFMFGVWFVIVCSLSLLLLVSW